MPRRFRLLRPSCASLPALKEPWSTGLLSSNHFDGTVVADFFLDRNPRTDTLAD